MKPKNNSPVRQSQLPPDKVNALITLYNAGRFAELENRARLLVDQFPDFGFGWKLLGGALQMQGKNALPAFQKTAELMPNEADAHYNLGVVLSDLGKLDDAVASYRLAVKIKPDFAEAHNNLGYLLQTLGQPDAALASCRRAIALKPNYAEAHNNLGNVMKDLGRLEEAVASYRRALTLSPDFALAHSNLGHVLQVLGNADAALASCRRAIELKPDFAEAHNNLGNALKELGQNDEAVASYRRAVEIDPDYAEAHNNMGIVLQVLGQFDNAVACCRRAVEIKPDYAEAYLDLGNSLKDLGQFDSAVANYRRALELKPDFAKAHCNLGVAMQNNEQLGAAVASYRRAVKIDPDFPMAHFNLGNVLQDLGRHDDALASYRRALELKPDFAGAHSNLLFCLSHSETVDAQTLFAEHCRFGERFEAPLRAAWPQHGNAPDPARTLQVGFVSGDLRSHAVASFIEPVLAHLSGYPQLSLHAYYNHTIDDPVTRRLRGYLTHWHPVVGLKDEALAEQIRTDGIDILIDLSGHTGENRLMTFAKKPAPVQASWMGYPGTTGLQAMDYYLADRFFLPPGQFDSQFTERIVRLPANAPFLPNKDAPPVNALPALSNGYMTFGSFNRPSKISRSTIALWAQLLRALPDARMLLGAMNKDGNYTTLIEWFAQEDIAPERLDFHVRSDMQTYLGLHHQVDICLDTFPYTGGTTTLHALWMGVPTLTLAGRTAAGRQGASILGHAGLDAFVAHDAAGLVQKGLSWAGDPAALSGIRTGLRERFAHSAMGQPALIAAGLERALRIMWQCWCAGLPPVAIDVSGNRMIHETRSLENEISANPGSQGR